MNRINPYSGQPFYTDDLTFLQDSIVKQTIDGNRYKWRNGTFEGFSQSAGVIAAGKAIVDGLYVEFTTSPGTMSQDGFWALVVSFSDSESRVNPVSGLPEDIYRTYTATLTRYDTEPEVPATALLLYQRATGPVYTDRRVPAVPYPLTQASAKFLHVVNADALPLVSNIALSVSKFQENPAKQTTLETAIVDFAAIQTTAYQKQLIADAIGGYYDLLVAREAIVGFADRSAMMADSEITKLRDSIVNRGYATQVQLGNGAGLPTDSVTTVLDEQAAFLQTNVDNKDSAIASRTAQASFVENETLDDIEFKYLCKVTWGEVIPDDEAEVLAYEIAVVYVSQEYFDNYPQFDPWDWLTIVVTDSAALDIKRIHFPMKTWAGDSYRVDNTSEVFSFEVKPEDNVVVFVRVITDFGATSAYPDGESLDVGAFDIGGNTVTQIDAAIRNIRAAKEKIKVQKLLDGVREDIVRAVVNAADLNELATNLINVRGKE